MSDTARDRAEKIAAEKYPIAGLLHIGQQRAYISGYLDRDADVSAAEQVSNAQLATVLEVLDTYVIDVDGVIESALELEDMIRRAIEETADDH